MPGAATVLHIEGDRVCMPAAALDHSGFREWLKSDDFPEGVRASYIQGEVFLEMSPESIESHNKAKTEITVELGRIVRDDDLGELYSDLTLLTHPEAALSTEPDALFCSWATLESGRVRLVPRAQRADEYIELEGSPDLVVEIVSDSSQRKDLVLLRTVYARAHIAEYWLVDARGAQLRFEILVLGPEGYSAAADATHAQPSAVLGRTFALLRERNRVGRWRYRLVAV
jgi:Uma2 family endonuclease